MKRRFFFGLLTPGRIIFILILIYIALLTVPYLRHKKVSENFQNDFSEREFYSSQAGSERIAYINDNTDALLYRLQMIQQAEQEIILSTFDFNADKGGKDVMAALMSAADRGVKVRVIIDGFSGFLDVKGKGTQWFQALASHENISLRIYNPLTPLKPWKMQARLHDKYLIIDHQMFLLGGRNTTNLFLGDYSKSKNIDREIFVYETEDNKASSLYQLRAYFEKIWALKDSREELILFADEIYDRLVFDGKTHTSIASLAPDLFVVTFNGLSKSDRIAGFRSGWMVLSGDLSKGKGYIEGINMLSSMRLCANVLAQHVVAPALKNRPDVDPLLLPGGRLYEQRKCICEAIDGVDGLSVVHPEAAFYIFPRIDAKRFGIQNDEQFVLDFLREKHVLLVHGGGFNWANPDHFRIVYLPEVSVLTESMKKMDEFLEKYR